ncbi:RIPOR family member 3 isoform X1 [Poecilia reticulata]|uniref:RIPOR family member 3 n=2 Tax=Poecilia reticulata TaxID=8081 RepID=A0A3P9QHB5_POERE|nr:PREDICTED: protein FAM65C isoform X1 [Poecilia reticulata]XP_017160073.1 PREDICTED: protein FAM65C isoform X1 [Poecilia reticulata]XP_017160074.1 PREDICTED: protein FAM65C isoform X1 [Poecilia reticulata]XP_017160075.1 PREDICTED: protein FAM65C isoform X1 [Poecilia reticulata]XP_017160076.1 PREDICTED: protein FAM65C isoform X1 [Poecilia reticulata]XP_017160077.1 PREDICTED: protein FAM65C isoform X1 [Poecilia reticulata]
MKKMSVKLRFNSPSDGGLIHRSRSFTGFGSLSGRPRSASIRGSFRSKNTMGSKPPRMHLSPRGGSAATWSQPEQVDRVFQALRSGLKEYLEVHQAEMELLSSQQRETKRNSRLAFLYDLEKEIKALERYIRRLEFQMSKVEELYETYCVQWKLCQGAVNMKRAFSLSPSTRASRESLLELGRSHRHSLQDMSTMEGDLEILLGELQIKMKGLIGFARLCPGDQYEVVVRLGRQRWKIRGRIESDDSQSWDEEEMVFLPHVYHNFEIKVMEAKGLGWLLVGMVTCAGVDFFVARPQLMLVDITELGTIKLQLEVTWNPFDSSEKMKPLSVSKQSVSSRKGSVYSWTAPNTPSFTEKYFMSMVRELQDQEGSLPSLVAKSRSSRGGVSLLSYLSDPSHTSATSGPQSLFLPSLTRAHSYPSTSLAGSQIQLSFEEEEEQRIEGKVDEEEWGGVSETSSAETIKTTSHLALPRSSTPDILRKNPSGETDTETQSAVLQQRGQQESSSIPAVSEAPSSPSSPSVRPKPSGAQRRSQTVRLAVLMAELEKSFGGESDAEKERRALEHQIQHLGTILKNDLSLLRSSASEETLAVEEVLGSFDFLSNDFNADDDTSCLGSVRLKDSGISSFQQSTLKSLGLLSAGSQSDSEGELVLAPLTSGNWGLDQALETHLDICCILLHMMKTSDFSLSRRELLQEMSNQTAVLDRVSGLLLEKSDNITPRDVLPKAQRSRGVLLFWEECVNASGSPFYCSVENFSRTLKRRYTHKVKAKLPGQSERVFSRLLQQLQAPCGLLPGCRPVCSPDRVTLFQLSVYLKRWSFQDLGEHISRLSREEYILSALNGPKRRKCLNKLRGRSLSELLPLQSTLQTVAALLVDSNHKVCKAAASCISRAAGCKAFRSKSVVFYTESLKSSDVLIQTGSCLALKCLRATESVERIVDLCRSADEDLRGVAKETVLSFGKKGFESFQRMEQMLADMQDEAYQNLETEITIL